MLGRPIFAALIVAASASGLEAMLGDAFVTLPPPAGFCELTPQYEFDGRLANDISKLLKQAGIRLLAMSADCAQLADARAGRRWLLDDVTEYQARMATIDKPPSESVAQTCTTLRGQGNAILGDVNVRLAGMMLDNTKIIESSFIGVRGEDKNACYAAILHKLRTAAGTEKTQVEMYAATIISNRSIGVFRYAAYQNKDTVDALLAKLKANVAALIAANP
ncbi:MAG TPA: hypothetical protein VGX95_18610 [Xanthobacteraceae bacterium]|jgi:hypothetical protein|nr:hypothetical protein [Xanthobacteraceae bacterium]